MIRWPWFALAVLAVGTLSFGARAQDDFPSDLSSECTLDNVAGAFGFNQDSLVNPSDDEGPAAVVGIIDLRPDGTAAMQVQAFGERGGSASMGPILEGEWSVEPNCFGFIDFPRIELAIGGRAEIDLAFVAVENATELFMIRNNPLEERDAKLLLRR